MGLYNYNEWNKTFFQTKSHIKSKYLKSPYNAMVGHYETNLLLYGPHTAAVYVTK